MKRKCPHCKRMILLDGNNLFTQHILGNDLICPSSLTLFTPKGILDGYKTYNPEKEGFGNESEWKRLFAKIFSQNEIDEILQGNDPYEILGVTRNNSPQEIRTAYLKLALQFHPDKNKDRDTTKEFQRINAAYQAILN